MESLVDGVQIAESYDSGSSCDCDACDCDCNCDCDVVNCQESF